MDILIVGNIIKDVYLNLDSSKNHFETDKNATKWLDFSFDASSNYYFSRNCSLGGAAVSLEVFEKLGVKAKIAGSTLKYEDGELVYTDHTAETHRYILITDSKASYLVPSKSKSISFTPPTETVDYLYIDRSASLVPNAVKSIISYLDISRNTKLILYLNNSNFFNLKPLLPRADLIIFEENRGKSEKTYAPELASISPQKIIKISENKLSYQNISEEISPSRVDVSTHLSLYSIAAATIIGSFILGNSVEDSLKFARANVENSKLDAVLDLTTLKDIAANLKPSQNLELIAASLLLPKKGILAIDESSHSIQQKFDALNIKNTEENRRNFRNLLLSTDNLDRYLSGVILSDETTKQNMDNGQSFVSYLISRRIVPGIKVDQGLASLPDSIETYTKGLEKLPDRLKEYYELGLRFTKWRSAFEIRINHKNEILTPTNNAINKNCQAFAKFAKESQSAGFVPILEPEVIYDGYYSIDNCEAVTSKILDQLFKELAKSKVNLKACILKMNMILAGKQFNKQSNPDEVGRITAKLIREHVPENLAGVVFLSGGQIPEDATENLASIIKNGPYPWPITFSFARALTNPALKTWSGNNDNIIPAQDAFKNRLEANSKAISNH